LRALITGINGFVGKHLAAFLQNESIEVFGIDRVTDDDTGALCYSADIGDQTAMRRIIEDIKPEHIYHLAGPAFIPDSYDNPVASFESIILGTVNILEAVRSSAHNSKLLIVGSSDEYGMYRGTPFIETMNPLPCTPYASAKAAAELICGQYARLYDMNIICTRSFNHLGPGQSPRFVTASMAKQIAELEKNGGKRIVLGNLNTGRDFLDVRDVVRAYFMIMELAGNSGETYNICSGREVSIRRVLDSFLALSDLPSRKGFSIEAEEQVRKFDNAHIVGDNSKLIKATGWAEKYSFEETIADTLNYWRSQV
jgi:GDP-4-dehydro-6-deoxy-D-mannose reductase